MNIISIPFVSFREISGLSLPPISAIDLPLRVFSRTFEGQKSKKMAI